MARFRDAARVAIVAGRAMSSLERFALLKSVGPALLRQTETRCSFQRYEANALVIDYDDPSSDVYFILSGAVRILYRAATGKEVILGEVGDGHYFGELAAIDAAPRSANVTTLQRSEMAVMPGAVFVELLNGSPELQLHLLTSLAVRVRTLNARLAEYTFLQARHRLYAELLRLSRPRPGHDGQRTVSPPPLQHDLANRISTRREVVSRELSALARAGIIEKTRGALVLADPGELNRRISAALDEQPRP